MRSEFCKLVRARPLVVAAAMIWIATLAFTACNADRHLPTGVQRLNTSRSYQVTGRGFAGSSHRRPAEDQFVRLTNEIPGFGGIFINSAHELVAYIKDTTTHRTLTASASTALKAHLASDGFGIPVNRPSSVRTVSADYDWPTLSAYRDFISDSLLGVRGVLIVAIDVAVNRVSVTVQQGSAASVAQILASHNIPPAAINISTGKSPGNMAEARRPSDRSRRFTPTFTTLQDYQPDSLMGGVRVAAVEGYCSIGAVVDSAGSTRLVTASHCTRTMWHLDGDSVSTASADLIGHETADPDPSVSCLSPCVYHRGSDDALFSMDATYGVAHAKLGVIGRTTSRDSSDLSGALHVSLNSSTPFLYIFDTIPSSSIVVGEEVDKMGQRSGWQKGQIFKVCADYWLITYTKKVYCTTEVYGLAMKGDSGGSIFFWDGYDGALFAGTANAFDDNYAENDSACVAYFFSNWSAVLAELGPVDPRNNTTIGTPSLTGSISSGNAMASWSAVSTTNTTDATEYQIFQWTWDASIPGYTQNEVYIGQITSLSYTDIPSPWTMTSATGDIQPDTCTYSSIGIEIRAYNRGATSHSNTVWFQGPANGPGGSC
jgi:hypothetical protein